MEIVFDVYRSLPPTAKSKVRIYAVDFNEEKIYEPQRLDEALEVVKRRKIEKEIKETFSPTETEKPKKKVSRKKKEVEKEKDNVGKTIFEFLEEKRDEIIKEKIEKRDEEEKEGAEPRT